MNSPTLPEKFLAAATFKGVCKIGYRDLNKLITEFFIGMTVPNPEWGKKSYECVAYEEWGNDSDHSFDVSRGEIDEFSQDVIDKAKNGKWEHFSLNDYLNHMCDAGIIPECELTTKLCHEALRIGSSAVFSDVGEKSSNRTCAV